MLSLCRGSLIGYTCHTWKLADTDTHAFVGDTYGSQRPSSIKVSHRQMPSQPWMLVGVQWGVRI